MGEQAEDAGRSSFLHEANVLEQPGRREQRTMRGRGTMWRRKGRGERGRGGGQRRGARGGSCSHEVKAIERPKPHDVPRTLHPQPCSAITQLHRDIGLHHLHLDRNHAPTISHICVRMLASIISIRIATVPRQYRISALQHGAGSTC